MGKQIPSTRLVEGSFSVPFFRVYVDGEFSRSYRGKTGIMVAGRDPAVDIPLEDLGISRKHFQIEYEGETRLYIQDLGSHNGTYVNGEKIIRAPLAHSDRIDLGRIHIIVSHPAHAPAEVIPFPSQKTDPGLEVAKKATAVVAQLPTKARTVTVEEKLPSAAPLPIQPLERIAIPIIVTLSAFILALGFYRWQSPRPVSEQKIVRAPAIPAHPIPRTEVPKIAEKIEPTIPLPATVRPKVESKSIMESLDRSLGDWKKDQLGSADKLVASGAEPSSRNEKDLKKMRAMDTKRMGVEIEMPKIDSQMLVAKAANPVQKASLKEFNAQAYQTALRSRIQGIDTCYVENVKSEGEPGRISVWFSISLSGDIKRSGVESSTFKNKDLENCIVAQLLKVKADPPPFDGFTLTYTFRFGRREIRF